MELEKGDRFLALSARDALTYNGASRASEQIADYLDWQNPFWRRQKLRNEKRKAELRVIRLGLKDSRLRLVRAKLNSYYGNETHQD